MQKRIMHLTFDMHIGGTEQVIKNLVESSDNTLFEMSIFCLEQPIGPFGEMLSKQGINIQGVQRKQGFDTSLIKAIRQHIIMHRIDVLHCHQYTPWVYGTLATIGTGIRIIFTEHGRFYPDTTSWKRKLVNPLLTLFTDKITAISKATKQALVDFEYIPAKKIEVIYNGIQPIKADPEKTQLLKQKLNISSTTTVLGTIARLDPIKNHVMMFEAYNKVLESHPDTCLILVGDGEERDNLEQLVRTLELQKQVIFTGYISEPQHYLDCMDIFLLSSLSEGTSMTLLEAMSLSKPCVVTDAGGNPEIIQHKYNGLVTENNDATKFAAAINHLLANSSFFDEMANNAQILFNDLYTAEKMCQNFKEIYM